MPYSMPMCQAIPFEPDDIVKLSKRINAALEPTYGEILLNTLPRPQVLKHVFDFRDGMRAVISFHKTTEESEEKLHITIIWPRKESIIELKESAKSDSIFLLCLGSIVTTSISRLFGFPICLCCDSVRPDMSMHLFGQTRKEIQDDVLKLRQHPNYGTVPFI